MPFSQPGIHSSPIFRAPWFFEVAMTDSEEPSYRPLCDNFAHLRFEAARLMVFWICEACGTPKKRQLYCTGNFGCFSGSLYRMRKPQHAGCQVTFEISFAFLKVVSGLYGAGVFHRHLKQCKTKGSKFLGV